VTCDERKLKISDWGFEILAGEEFSHGWEKISEDISQPVDIG
jgi:hypothetical protein